MTSIDSDFRPLSKQETFWREANHLFDFDRAELIRQLCGEISQFSLKKNIYSNYDEFHGEIKNGLKTPHDEHLYEHLVHLSFFEAQFQKPKLKILDLCCGNGKFTFVARKKGHTCIATDSIGPDSFSFDNFDSIQTKSQCISAMRSLTREILNVDFINLNIKWNSPLSLGENDFDIIYINQATLHYPGSGTHEYWQNDHWDTFFTNALNLLEEDGLIFITLADPSYMHLSEFLLQFYAEYSDHITLIHPTHWWPLLLIQKRQWDSVKKPSEFSLVSERKYFKHFGRSNSEAIRLRL